MFSLLGSGSMFISVTRLRLRSRKFLLPLLWHIFHVRKQVGSAKDCRQFKLRVERQGKKLIFWTLSLWTDKGTMQAFRNGGPHGKVMPHLRHWCDEASYTNWESNDEALPEWLLASEHLKLHGKPSFVNFPSEAHQAGQTVG
jgi:hypothetical protein